MIELLGRLPARSLRLDKSGHNQDDHPSAPNKIITEDELGLDPIPVHLNLREVVS